VAGFRHGSEPKLAFGLLDAAVTLWATFGAPYVARLSANPRLAGALAGVTAAVVGIILNLSLWFALHVLLGTVSAARHGPVLLWTPDAASLNIEAVMLAVLAAVLMFGLRLGVLATLAITAAAARAWSLIHGSS
jgi:chromate transporter